MNMRNLYTSICFVLFNCFVLMAQQEVQIIGTVLEHPSNVPVEFATVLVADKDSKKALVGTTTDMEGNFRLETDATNFYVEISFMGYDSKRIETFTVKNGMIQLGTIMLSENLAELDEVVVRAEKSQTVFKLDKRVFNVGSDLSSTGASALEILNNVPSVNVNIEGQISLRGSQGVQILINGKPSVLASEEGNALGSITAEMIESIEVITNPSAKYEASGTSGIINIIIKKSEKRGLNGSITLNTGIPNNHSVGLSMNRRSEKFNLFGQIAYGRRTFPRESETLSIDKNTLTQLRSDGDADKHENFFNLILGTDYHINDNNVITLTGNYAFEAETETADQYYTFTEANGNLTDAWNRREDTEADNPKWQYELQYKSDFEGPKDHSLLFSALGSSFAKDKLSNFANTTIIGNNENMLQSSDTDFAEYEYTFKLDYTRPFSEKYTLETGAQYVINDVSNDFEVRDFINNDWVVSDEFSNVFDYKQDVLGVYSTFAYEGDKWGLKGGLRLEHTELRTELQNTNEVNSRNFTNLFPSVHTSYKFTDDLSVQAGYSKRIFRPSLWDLNPFVSFRDNFNLSTGNPNLDPEFTDSYEVTGILKFKGGSLNLGVYYRDTQDVIEDITTFENNVTTRKPENVGTNKATGIELNTKYSLTEWLTLTADLNYNTFKREGSFESLNFDFSNDQWFGRMTSKLKLPADFTAEITGNYRSEYQDVQSTIADNAFMDIGVRKKMMKGRLNANLSIRDVFASRRRQSVTDQADFFQRYHSQRGRFITFGVSFGFGKGEAMEYSGQKRF